MIHEWELRLEFIKRRAIYFFKMNVNKKAILLILITTFLTSAAQILFKTTANDLVFDIGRIITNYNLLIGLLLYLIGGILVIISFRHGEITILYPILATSYVWVNLLSNYFFEEQINIFKWAGIAAIIIGVSLLGFGKKNIASIKEVENAN